MLEIQVEQSTDYVVCRPMGELDAYTVGQFRESLAELAGTARLLIDLSEVPFMDSAGLGALIGIGIGKLIDFIIACLEDDIVGSIHTQVSLASLAKSYYDKTWPTAQHPKRNGRFNGPDGMWYKRDFTAMGKYRVKLGWRVYTASQADARRAEIAAHPKTKLP